MVRQITFRCKVFCGRIRLAFMNISRLFFRFLVVVMLSALSFQHAFAAYDYEPDIQYLYDQGITDEVNFDADAFLTKGEFVIWALKNAGYEPDFELTPHVPYKDINDSDAVTPYLKKLLDARILQFSQFEPTFKPSRFISRYNSLELLFKIEGIPAPFLFDEEWFKSVITDVNSNSYIAPLASKAIELGLLPRFEPKQFKPFYPLTQKHAARLLYNAHVFSHGPLPVRTSNPPPIASTTIFINSPTGQHELIKHPKFDTLLSVWDKLTKQYIDRDSLDKDDLVYGAINGLVERVGDKYTEFQEPAASAIFQESLNGRNLEGIGAMLEMNEANLPVVISPLNGSPAEEAGVEAGDVITHINGVTTEGLALSEVVNKIRGPKGTNVTLTVLRPATAQTLDITITRAAIVVPTVTSELTEDGITILTLSSFSATANTELTDFVHEALDAGSDKFVLDLRNNPGGFLDTGIAVASQFLDKGQVVVKVAYPERTDVTETQYKGLLHGFPLAVLVNKGSASASEIVAGALQDHGAAVLVGETTFGKGTVQELTNYTDGSSFKYTVARWLTPNNNAINKTGVTPDFNVPMTAEQRKSDFDPQLNWALRELRK
jgi:carboxyl-terminal processing protease